MNMKFGKKGDMSFSVLVKIILGLLVIVIMASIIWNYASKSSKNADNASENAIDQVTKGKCEVLGFARKCCGTDPAYTKKINNKEFSDCNECCDKG
jgi:uncharacterized protein (UPF0333 family)